MKRKNPGLRQGKWTAQTRATDEKIDRHMVVADISSREAKREFYERLNTPGYRAFVERLVHVAETWRLFNSTVALEWQDSDEMLMSGSLGDPVVQGYLAKNEAAFELLRYMDEETGRRASLLQATFALGAAGLLHQKRTTRTTDTKCPHCSVLVGAQTSFEGKTPREGDITMCLGCGGFCCFGPQLELDVLSDERWHALPRTLRERLERERDNFLKWKAER